MHPSGKRVLITGAGHGLGRALALAFAREAAEVIVTDQDAQRVAHMIDEIKSLNGLVSGYTMDVIVPEQIRAVRDQLLAERGPIDILVNNAGIVHGGDLVNVPIEKHFETIEVNLCGTLLVTQIFLPDLVARPEAYIVNIASAAAVVPVPWGVSYAASKAAVLAFSDSLREELRVQRHLKVEISTICPSFINTGLFDGATPPRLTWTLTPERVANAVVRAVHKNRKFVMVPWTARLLYSLASVLPGPCFRGICRLMGVSRSMIHWKGRSPQA
jgi:all-trans-retinol dehydrogenase (NAD+)